LKYFTKNAKESTKNKEHTIEFNTKIYFSGDSLQERSVDILPRRVITQECMDLASLQTLVKEETQTRRITKRREHSKFIKSE
jgi:hypothetical protein